MSVLQSLLGMCHNEHSWCSCSAREERSECCAAKETSSPTAPVRDLAKASNVLLAGSVPDGADVLSSCYAGRQYFWPGIQSDAHLDAKALCSREMAWTVGREVFVTTYSEWASPSFVSDAQVDK